jgi:hypothetical protein
LHISALGAQSGSIVSHKQYLTHCRDDLLSLPTACARYCLAPCTCRRWARSRVQARPRSRRAFSWISSWNEYLTQSALGAQSVVREGYHDSRRHTEFGQISSLNEHLAHIVVGGTLHMSALGAQSGSSAASKSSRAWLDFHTR